MTWRITMRSIHTKMLISLLSSAALIAAIVLSFGCAHEDLGPFDTIEEFTGWGEGSGEDSRSLGLSIDGVGIHSIDVGFTSSMDRTSVEAVVHNEAGDEIPGVTLAWKDSTFRVLNLRGPFEFCKTYDVMILAGARSMDGVLMAENISLSAEMVPNPLDVDATSACTADVALSPIFTDAVDAGLVIGDYISRQDVVMQFDRADFDNDDVFYVGGLGLYDDADRMVRVPASNEGHAWLTKLFIDEVMDPEGGQLASLHYTLGLWCTCDPVGEPMTSSFTHDISGSSSWRLHGPFDGGDLDGDGSKELVISNEIARYDGSVLQEIRVLGAPAAYKGGFLLADIAGAITVFGSDGEAFSPPFTLGDVDGDGMGDLGIMRNRVSDLMPSDWQLWIVHGKEDLGEIFHEASDKIKAYPGRMIVDADAGDLNGDGVSDLIVAELEHISIRGRYVDMKPHVGIIFGGRDDFEDLNMIMRDVDLLFKTTDSTDVSVRVLGDVDGNGFNDVGIWVGVEDAYHRVVSSKVYLFMGRDEWYESYYMTSNLVDRANVIVDATDYDDIVWKDNFFDPMIGDVDNDGYYDFAIMRDDGIERTIYWFFGKNSYSQVGWKLDLDDADSTWVFSDQ